MLGFLLPALPPLTIPAISRASSLKVYLQRNPEPATLKQNLHDPASIVSKQLMEQDTRSATPLAVGGVDQTISEATPQVNAERTDRSISNPSGTEANAGLRPRAFFSRSSIRIFAQQEAFLHAEQNPDLLQRFKRRFRSSLSHRRRNNTESYRNRYGDYYIRNSSSVGDICYLQEKNHVVGELSTNTVYFFRCNSKPAALKLTESSS